MAADANHDTRNKQTIYNGMIHTTKLSKFATLYLKITLSKSSKKPMATKYTQAHLDSSLVVSQLVLGDATVVVGVAV